MEASLKNLELNVAMCKKMPDVAVIMGTHFKAHQACLHKLKSNNKSDVLYTGVESACMGFALYEAVRDKMIGSPLEVARSGVSHVSCNSLNGKFLLTWNTQGSMSKLRKTIGLALSCMAPHKLYSKYAENCKLMGCPSDRRVFNKLANEMSDAIKKGVKICVIGKIKLDTVKMKDILAKTAKKLPAPSHEKDVATIPKHEEFVVGYPHVKSSGIAAVAVADYILSKSGGMSVCVSDGKVVVYNKSWPTKQNALKKTARINDYVRQKYEKLNKEFSCIFGYLAITRGLADCCTVSKIIKTNPTPAAVSALLKQSM